MNENYPKNFLAAGWNVGIKDASLDFGVIHSGTPCNAAAVFTKNNFPGHPVVVGREHARSGRLQTIMVNSKNANVATGPDGLALCRESCDWAARALGIAPELVLPSSTGVIGKPMPRDKIQAACRSIPGRLTSADFDGFAHAIMTTDRFPKRDARTLASGIRLFGCAKGAGMIEPNMATMLAYFCTDAAMEAADLDRLLRTVVNLTFNRISVDSDTSTSDTAVVLANGASGVRIGFSPEAEEFFLERNLRAPADLDGLDLPGTDPASQEFTRNFWEIALDLARDIARDGEGATKLMEIRVTEARDRSQALKIARSVVNSPLVKTAVYGADPNWGRLIMAVGKVFDEPIPLTGLRIFFGDMELTQETDPKILSGYLQNSEIVIRLSLGTGKAEERVWGCDLNEAYVKLNALYTT